ncbi:MAG TPA: helical backbone metal receptor [Acidimicrobiales bacterium]|jgi:ABC-type Fe3+-hydroxamate transport system substrate-binding protein|nr:helical backbone metal receptor [Acidimicrobiales bacterium]
MDVVSLVPSVTETLLAWGIEPMACTRFCEQPGRVHVGGTKDPDIAGIVSLAPDLVVVDEEENRREDYQALVAAGLPVHVLAIRDLTDVDPAMGELARRVGADWEPLPERRHRSITKRAFVPIWRRPWMALGAPTYGTSLLSALGIDNVFADQPYPTVTLEEATERRPCVVLAPSEPYPFTRRQLPDLESVAPTVFIDGKDLFWWGTRTAGALERLDLALADLP